MADEHSTTAVVAALAANMGIALMKFVGFAFTGSGSMLAEAVHSVADTGNEALLLLGGHKAKRMADVDHPFGYGRERYFWAFVVSVLLFTLGGAFSIFDGIDKLRNPHELESAGWAIGILLAAMVLEALSFRTGIRATRHVKGSVGWWRFIRIAKTPELPVVLLEDLAALLGLSIALVAIATAEITGESRYDAIGSLAIGVLLVIVALILAVEMRSLLIGESADPAVERRIVDAMEGDDQVCRVIHIRTEHLGPEELLVAAKLEFDGSLTMRELADVVNEVEARVRKEVPQARVMYLEPDVTRTADEMAQEQTAAPADPSA
jgi:cation diffusion facilitator family transporter